MASREWAHLRLAQLYKIKGEKELMDNHIKKAEESKDKDLLQAIKKNVRLAISLISMARPWLIIRC